MIPPLTPPSSPQALQDKNAAFEEDFAFVVNQKREPGNSFVYNLEQEGNGYFDDRRDQILRRIPLTSSLYLLSDPSTSLYDVLEHCTQRVGRAVEEARGGPPTEFYCLEPLLGQGFIKGMEKAFDRGKEDGFTRYDSESLWNFFMWTRDHVKEKAESHRISYEAFIADRILLRLKPILWALQRLNPNMQEINRIIVELEKSAPYVATDVRVAFELAKDDATRIVEVQSLVDRYKRHLLYGEIPPFLLFHPYPSPAPPPSPSPPPFVDHHPTVEQSFQGFVDLVHEFPYLFPLFYTVLACIFAYIGLQSSYLSVYCFCFFSSVFCVSAPLFQLYVLFVYEPGRKKEEVVASKGCVG